MPKFSVIYVSVCMFDGHAYRLHARHVHTPCILPSLKGMFYDNYIKITTKENISQSSRQQTQRACATSAGQCRDTYADVISDSRLNLKGGRGGCGNQLHTVTSLL